MPNRDGVVQRRRDSDAEVSSHFRVLVCLVFRVCYGTLGFRLSWPGPMPRETTAPVCAHCGKHVSVRRRRGAQRATCDRCTIAMLVAVHYVRSDPPTTIYPECFVCMAPMEAGPGVIRCSRPCMKRLRRAQRDFAPQLGFIAASEPVPPWEVSLPPEECQRADASMSFSLPSYDPRRLSRLRGGAYTLLTDDGSDVPHDLRNPPPFPTAPVLAVGVVPQGDGKLPACDVRVPAARGSTAPADDGKLPASDVRVPAVPGSTAPAGAASESPAGTVDGPTSSQAPTPDAAPAPEPAGDEADAGGKRPGKLSPVGRGLISQIVRELKDGVLEANPAGVSRRKRGPFPPEPVVLPPGDLLTAREFRMSGLTDMPSSSDASGSTQADSAGPEISVSGDRVAPGGAAQDGGAAPDPVHGAHAPGTDGSGPAVADSGPLTGSGDVPGDVPGAVPGDVPGSDQARLRDPPTVPGDVPPTCTATGAGVAVEAGTASGSVVTDEAVSDVGVIDAVRESEVVPYGTEGVNVPAPTAGTSHGAGTAPVSSPGREAPLRVELAPPQRDPAPGVVLTTPKTEAVARVDLARSEREDDPSDVPVAEAERERVVAAADQVATATPAADGDAARQRAAVGRPLSPVASLCPPARPRYEYVGPCGPGPAPKVSPPGVMQDPPRLPSRKVQEQEFSDFLAWKRYGDAVILDELGESGGVGRVPSRAFLSPEDIHEIRTSWPNVPASGQHPAQGWTEPSSGQLPAQGRTEPPPGERPAQGGTGPPPGALPDVPDVDGAGGGRVPPSPPGDAPPRAPSQGSGDGVGGAGPASDDGGPRGDPAQDSK